LDAGFKAICTHPGKARRSEPADFGIAPAKRPLIDIAMSANAAPTMSGMFGNAAKGAGHAYDEPGILDALIKATDCFAQQV
jgi:hypothetical protein